MEAIWWNSFCQRITSCMVRSWRLLTDFLFYCSLLQTRVHACLQAGVKRRASSFNHPRLEHILQTGKWPRLTTCTWSYLPCALAPANATATASMCRVP